MAKNSWIDRLRGQKEEIERQREKNRKRNGQIERQRGVGKTWKVNGSNSKIFQGKMDSVLGSKMQRTKRLLFELGLVN